MPLFRKTRKKLTPMEVFLAFVGIGFLILLAFIIISLMSHGFSVLKWPVLDK